MKHNPPRTLLALRWGVETLAAIAGGSAATALCFLGVSVTIITHERHRIDRGGDERPKWRQAMAPPAEPESRRLDIVLLKPAGTQ